MEKRLLLTLALLSISTALTARTTETELRTLMDAVPQVQREQYKDYDFSSETNKVALADPEFGAKYAQTLFQQAVKNKENNKAVAISALWQIIGDQTVADDATDRVYRLASDMLKKLLQENA